jgi:hypothetical protein
MNFYAEFFSGFFSGIFTGVFAGVLLKNHVLRILEKTITTSIGLFQQNHKPKSMEKKVFLVCKINDLELFDEHFPVLNTKYRVQPSWEYSKSKQTIKIELTEFNFDTPIGGTEFLDTTGIDIEFFETFCKLSIYIHYFVENREYINVYQNNETIDPRDFNLTETDLSKRYRSLICAIFNNGREIYITRYFKMFLNNKYPFTTEQLLMYNDDIDSLNGTLKLVDGKLIKIHHVNELI